MQINRFSVELNPLILQSIIGQVLAMWIESEHASKDLSKVHTRGIDS